MTGDLGGPRDSMSPAVATERSHSGLVQRFAKPPSGVTCFEGSNPSLSASRHSVACARSSVDRALGCGPKGREFESRRARHSHDDLQDMPNASSGRGRFDLVGLDHLDERRTCLEHERSASDQTQNAARVGLPVPARTSTSRLRLEDQIRAPTWRYGPIDSKSTGRRTAGTRSRGQETRRAPSPSPTS